MGGGHATGHSSATSSTSTSRPRMEVKMHCASQTPDRVRGRVANWHILEFLKNARNHVLLMTCVQFFHMLHFIYTYI